MVSLGCFEPHAHGEGFAASVRDLPIVNLVAQIAVEGDGEGVIGIELLDFVCNVRVELFAV